MLDTVPRFHEYHQPTNRLCGLTMPIPKSSDRRESVNATLVQVSLLSGSALPQLVGDSTSLAMLGTASNVIKRRRQETKSLHFSASLNGKSFSLINSCLLSFPLSLFFRFLSSIPHPPPTLTRKMGNRKPWLAGSM